MKEYIRADDSRILPDLSNLYNYRFLIWSFAWRDIKVRFSQTFLGFLWVLINPIVNLSILYFVFVRIANVNSSGVPSLPFIFSGIVVWNYYSNLLSEGGNSIIGAQNMIKKIYFPRLSLPISKAISGLVGLAVSLLLLFVLLIFFNIEFNSKMIYIPVILILVVTCGLGGVIWISALSIRYRDFKFIVPVLLRLGMFLSPIGYSSSEVPVDYQLLYNLNPLTGIIDIFRWILFSNYELSNFFYVSILINIILFLTGMIYFNVVEKTMADII